MIWINLPFWTAHKIHYIYIWIFFINLVFCAAQEFTNFDFVLFKRTKLNMCCSWTWHYTHISHGIDGHLSPCESRCTGSRFNFVLLIDWLYLVGWENLWLKLGLTTNWPCCSEIDCFGVQISLALEWYETLTLSTTRGLHILLTQGI